MAHTKHQDSERDTSLLDRAPGWPGLARTESQRFFRLVAAPGWLARGGMVTEVVTAMVTENAPVAGASRVVRAPNPVNDVVDNVVDNVGELPYTLRSRRRYDSLDNQGDSLP
jgi:hypothetical protein